MIVELAPRGNDEFQKKIDVHRMSKTTDPYIAGLLDMLRELVG